MKAKKIAQQLLVAGIGGAVAFVLFMLFFGNQTIVVQQPPVPIVRTSYTPPPENFSLAAEKSIHAVVHVKSIYANSLSYNPLYDFFFGEKGTEQDYEPMYTSGSGVIMSPDGYIVTNNHVIAGADHIEIVLNDRRSFKAKVIGTDPTTDLALLKIDATNLETISLADSEKLRVGQWVLAVGNPFNLTSTVTAGIVSAKGRNINILSKQPAIESFIQTDAAVNPGNSGGALVNTVGELVGINTAIASNTGTFAGYSFAIPVSIVQKVVADLKQYGAVQRGMLGINIRDIDARLAKKLRIEKIEGIYVSSVDEGGAASQAGIQKNDIILKINSSAVKNVAELQEQVNKYRPGDKIKVTVQRNNELIQCVPILQNRKGSTDIVDSDLLRQLGAEFKALSREEKNELNIKNGLKIKKLNDGKLLKAGVKQNFIITKINRHPIKSVNDLHQILNYQSGGVYIEGLYPDGNSAYYAFGIR